MLLSLTPKRRWTSTSTCLPPPRPCQLSKLTNQPSNSLRQAQLSAPLDSNQPARLYAHSSTPSQLTGASSPKVLTLIPTGMFLFLKLQAGSLHPSDQETLQESE